MKKSIIGLLGASFALTFALGGAVAQQKISQHFNNVAGITVVDEDVHPMPETFILHDDDSDNAVMIMSAGEKLFKGEEVMVNDVSYRVGDVEQAFRLEPTGTQAVGTPKL